MNTFPTQLERLLKVANDVITIFLKYQEDIDLTSQSFEIVPFYDHGDKDSAVVSINFVTWNFSYEFLEPLAEKLSKTNIQWSIDREQNKFMINLYY